MSELNVIYKGRNNPVVFEFEFTGDFSNGGLNNFSDIELNISGEIYTTVNDPDSLYITNETILTLNIGTTTQLVKGEYATKIVGFDNGNYVAGYVLTCPEVSKVDNVKVVQ